MVGVDATSKQQEAIQKGEELGVLSQNPYAMGYQDHVGGYSVYCTEEGNKD